MLQIGVERHNPVSVGRGQSSCQCKLVAEIPRETNSPNARIHLRGLQDGAPRLVGGTVVDDDQLRRAVESVQHGKHPLDEMRQGRRFVEGRCDNAQVHLHVINRALGTSEIHEGPGSARPSAKKCDSHLRRANPGRATRTPAGLPF